MSARCNRPGPVAPVARVMRLRLCRMEERVTEPKTGDDIHQAMQVFYDLHPYPPPATDLEEFRRSWQDGNRRRADFHLHWPHQSYREDLRVLVAGCGTSQAARHALRRPGAQVTGIDLSEAGIRHTLALKQKYALSNLEVHRLPIERVGELGQVFDLIICTGVLHHLPDPQAGLLALREVLAQDGAINLMVYAAYGRAGVTMLQEYCRRLGIGHTDQEIRDLAQALTTLPHNHPLAHLLAESPDFKTRAGLADALLNPQDRAYTVSQAFDLIGESGLVFHRWVRQAPYLPQCSRLTSTPHAPRLAQLPLKEQYAALELFRGNMLRHSLILYRKDRAGDPCLPRFDGDDWPGYTPLRLPETASLRQRLPAGAVAALLNRNHNDPDLLLFVDSAELQLVEAIDGRRTIAEIIEHVASSHPGAHPAHDQARSLFQRLWWYDQVVFDMTRPGS
jgi:SAM-dependent methyltransferase